MANFNVTPNMQLPNPVPGMDPGPDYADNLESSLDIIDQHNHSAGQGVLIQPNGINISSDLPFNSNNAVTLRSVRFLSQLSPIPNTAPDVGILYVSGNELWYNDYTGGNQVQITTNGLINATSSGISSGTATAAFSGGVLVVKSSSTSFANVDLQSVVLANAGNITNQLTLLAPTLSSSYDLTLPLVPLANSFLQIDTSGNISAGPAIVAGITGSNIAPATIAGSNIAAATITGSNVAATTIAGSNMVNGTITGTQVSNDIDLPGKAVQAGNLNVVVNGTNNTNSLAIIRGTVASSGAATSGEGFTSVLNSTGVYTISFTAAFQDIPSVVATVTGTGFGSAFVANVNVNVNSAGIYIQNITPTQVDSAFNFIAIGMRT